MFSLIKQAVQTLTGGASEVLTPLPLDSAENYSQAWLMLWIKRHMPTCRLRINHNRVTMLSLRYGRHGVIASIHANIFAHPQAVAEIPAWIKSRGDVVGPQLKAALNHVFLHQRHVDIEIDRAALPAMPPPLQPLDLHGALEHVHGTWFSDLPKPAIKWGRNPGDRDLSSIRFGCYSRRPRPLITLHPRLQRTWVPWIFIEHVLYHELCHHRQACEPIAREAHHSRRFQQWEQTYPNHELATKWQHLYIDRILKGRAD